jgi:hypothetical protein
MLFDLEALRMNPVGLIFVAAGLFSICGAAFDWDFFINSRKTQFFVSIFGRNGARIVYGILGRVIVVMGALITLGILKNPAISAFAIASLVKVSVASEAWQLSGGDARGDGWMRLPRFGSEWPNGR